MDGRSSGEAWFFFLFSVSRESVDTSNFCVRGNEAARIVPWSIFNDESAVTYIKPLSFRVASVYNNLPENARRDTATCSNDRVLLESTF